MFICRSTDILVSTTWNNWYTLSLGKKEEERLSGDISYIDEMFSFKTSYKVIMIKY